MFYEHKIEFNSSFEELPTHQPLEECDNNFQTLKEDISFNNSESCIDLFRLEKLQTDERKKFLNLPFVKFNKGLKLLFSSDIVLENTFMECIKEISGSSEAFAIEIISLEVEMENEFDDGSEILINVKVPRESQMDIVDKFWNCVGLRITNIIEELKMTNANKAEDLYDRLFVIVDY